MSTGEWDSGGEPPCMMAFLDEEGTMPDGSAPIGRQDSGQRDAAGTDQEQATLEALLDRQRAALPRKVVKEEGQAQRA